MLIAVADIRPVAVRICGRCTVEDKTPRRYYWKSTAVQAHVEWNDGARPARFRSINCHYINNYLNIGHIHQSLFTSGKLVSTINELNELSAGSAIRLQFSRTCHLTSSHRSTASPEYSLSRQCYRRSATVCTPSVSPTTAFVHSSSLPPVHSTVEPHCPGRSRRRAA